MFAVCIEKNSTDYGKQLLAHAKNDESSRKGLATMPFENQSTHERVIENDFKATLVEQSIFDDLGSEITRLKDQDVYISGWLRIDNRTELSVNLGLPEGANYSDRELILKAYQKWGDTFGRYLVGDFSFALIDVTKSKVYLVRDHFGVRPLYCYLSLNVSEEFIVARCMSVSADWVKTPYTEVSKVPPASIAEFNLAEFECAPKVAKYHDFDQDFRLKLANEDEYTQHYQDMLSEAVKCRVSGVKAALATESSGGIDSSTIAALAAKHMTHFKENLHAFGYVMCEQEEECINLLSEYVGIENTYLIKDNELYRN